jgi:hypothetical protein
VGTVRLAFAWSCLFGSATYPQAHGALLITDVHYCPLVCLDPMTSQSEH